MPNPRTRLLSPLLFFLILAGHAAGADLQTKDLPEATTAAATDILGLQVDVSGTFRDRKMTLGNLAVNLDPQLTAIANSTPAANKLWYWSSLTAGAFTDLSSFARTLLDDADAATARATLGLSNVENTAISTWAGSANLTTGAGGLFGTAAYTAATAYAPAAAALPTGGTTGQLLSKASGTNYDVAWTTVAGAGDVTAAAAFSTDNRVIRSDGTGKGVQASGLTLDDSANLTGIANTGTTTITLAGTLLTPTAAEFNRVAGVTSAIQTQLDAKANLAGGNTFTGAQVFGAITATTLNGNAITAGSGTLTLGTATLNAGTGGTLGSAAFTAATAYAPATSGSAILKGNGSGGFSSATAGTDYTSPSSTETMTNKRITARVTTITSSATPTVNTDNADCVTITALATAVTSMTANLSGTPNNFDQLEYRIKDDGTAHAIAFGASFATGTGTLPTTTNAGKVLHVFFEWDAVQSKWVCLSTGSEP